MILRDITKSRRTAQQTIESERLNALTLLAAGVAHEIGNPLNSLHIHLQLMERSVQKLHGEAKAEPTGFDCDPISSGNPAIAATAPSGEPKHDNRGGSALFHTRNSRP